MSDHIVMTKRRNKDKEIEELKARNEYLENKNRIFSSWRKMGKAEKNALAAYWVLALVLTVFALIVALLLSPALGEEEVDWAYVSSVVGGRDWEISSSSRSDLLSLYPGSDGRMSVKAYESISLLVTLSSDSGDSFCFLFQNREGRMTSFWGGELVYLTYSESSTGGGKTIVLTCGKKKLVFREKK